MMETFVHVSDLDHENGDDVLGFWEQRWASCHFCEVTEREVEYVSAVRIEPCVEVGC
jgi:hypothetical protein